MTATSAPLSLLSLAWSVGSVDATSGTASADLTWTVSDTAKGVHNVLGALVIGVPRSGRGRFASLTFTVGFALHGPSQSPGSGNAHQSTYRYTFDVPQYAQVSPAPWQVTGFTVRDDRGNRLMMSATQLGSFNAVLTATEIIDTGRPSYKDLARLGRPFVYVARHHPGSAAYVFSANDNLAGLYSARIQIKGPNGRTLSSDIPVDRVALQCGFEPNSSLTSMSCGINFPFPADTPVGRWAVSTLQLTDDAGNTAIFSRLNAVPVTVTSNQVIQANNFRAIPNPVSNWSSEHPYTVDFSMRISAPRGRITAVYIDTSTDSGATCAQTTTRPTRNGSRVTVPIRVDWRMEVCQVVGIALVDGKGDVALYGPNYGAPDPYFLIRQVPNVSAPQAASAEVNPATVQSSQIGPTTFTMTIKLKPGYAPATISSATVYDSHGNVVTEINGGPVENNGVVTETFSLPDMTPGLYPIGFSLTNDAQMTTDYGYGGNPLPGGPLALIVTKGPVYNAYQDQLYGIAALSPSNVWAVGLHCLSTCGGIVQDPEPLVIHWNGKAWTDSTLPTLPGGYELKAVSAVSATDIWAVGGGDGVNQTNVLILHWNGNRWSRVPSSAAGILDSVSAGSAANVWAVGYSGFATTLAMHWDGQSWTQAATPEPGNQNEAFLTSVRTVSSSGAWAAGYYYTSSNFGGQTLVLHWTGTQWVQVVSQDPNSTGSKLAGITTSPGGSWAAGWSCPMIAGSCPVGADKTLIFRRDGATWDPVPSPDPGANNDLEGISARTGTDAWAVGSFAKTGFAPYSTLVLHWNGVTWAETPSPNPATGSFSFNFLYSLSADSAKDAWSVGYDCSLFCGGDEIDHAMILHWNGVRWSVK